MNKGCVCVYIYVCVSFIFLVIERHVQVLLGQRADSIQEVHICIALHCIAWH